jgi:hypothetical protein
MSVDRESPQKSRKSESHMPPVPETRGDISREETSKMLGWWKEEYVLNEKDRLWKELNRSRAIRGGREASVL